MRHDRHFARHLRGQIYIREHRRKPMLDGDLEKYSMCGPGFSGTRRQRHKSENLGGKARQEQRDSKCSIASVTFLYTNRITGRKPALAGALNKCKVLLHNNWK